MQNNTTTKPLNQNKMNAKLYKTEKENYVLVDPTKGTYDDGYTLGTSRESQYNKLSIKNCETIERGYDLGELAMGYDLYENINFVGQTRAYKAGFQKALEILGDKKFSEKELTMLFVYGHQIGMNTVLSIQSQHSPQPMDKPDSDKLRDEFIQSLKQTEWQVEVVYHRACNADNFNCGNEDKCQICTKVCPKLDENGCIILKRI